MTVENCRYIFRKLLCESCHFGSSELNRSVCAVKLLTCFGVTLAPKVDRETSFVALLRIWRRKSGLWCDLISDATHLESRWKPMEAANLTGEFCGFPPVRIKDKGHNPGKAQQLCTHVNVQNVISLGKLCTCSHLSFQQVQRWSWRWHRHLIRHEVGLDRPVSTLSYSFFKGLLSRLRPFGL
jgi:hypothetical protein